MKRKITPFIKTDNFTDLVTYLLDLQSSNKLSDPFRKVIIAKRDLPENPSFAYEMNTNLQYGCIITI